jgi:hypothetical protein
MSKYQDCDDSIRKIDSQTKGSYIETLHYTQKEAQRSQSWIWYLTALSVFIFLFSVWVYTRKHKQSIQELKHAEIKQQEQKNNLHQQVIEKSRQAVKTAIAEQRKALMQKNRNALPQQRIEMQLQMYNEVIHFNNKTHFVSEMNLVMNNLYTKLETQYKSLNETDLQWACLHMLNVQREDIMELLQLNVEAYKKMRQRFAQKVGVSSIKSIDAFLADIWLS